MASNEHLRFEFTNWLHDMAPWEWFFTGTFSYEASNAAAQRAWKRFMTKYMSDVSWFYVTERNPSRPGYHIHALLHGVDGYSSTAIWNKWFKRFGINRLEPVRSRMKVEEYTTKHCANYLTKGYGHYDFELNDKGLWANAKKEEGKV
tara:strand:+ start:290 stop:730 length:441 start_codon:yes stop_codon:yes gene_type:complete